MQNPREFEGKEGGWGGSWLPDPAGIRDLNVGILKVVLPVKAASCDFSLCPVVAFPAGLH